MPEKQPIRTRQIVGVPSNPSPSTNSNMNFTITQLLNNLSRKKELANKYIAFDLDTGSFVAGDTVQLALKEAEANNISSPSVLFIS
jgi:hypothetical protein